MGDEVVPCSPQSRGEGERGLDRSGDAHAWIVSLDLCPRDMRSLEAVVSPDEMERANRLVAGLRRSRWIAGRGVLRSILSTYLGVAPADVIFSYTTRGKPYVASSSGSAAIRFNLSHCGDRAFIAVTAGREIGVDIERVRENPFDEAVARRFFVPEEQRLLRATPQDEWSAVFFAIWTRKEACIKASDLPFPLALASFDASLRADAPRVIARRADASPGACWTVVDIETTAGYVAACAVEGRGLRIVRREFHIEAGR